MVSRGTRKHKLLPFVSPLSATSIVVSERSSSHQLNRTCRPLCSGHAPVGIPARPFRGALTAQIFKSRTAERRHVKFQGVAEQSRRRDSAAPLQIVSFQGELGRVATDVAEWRALDDILEKPLGAKSWFHHASWRLPRSKRTKLLLKSCSLHVDWALVMAVVGVAVRAVCFLPRCKYPSVVQLSSRS